MRVIVFFDLPVLTAKQRKHYRWFRNALIKEGFIMMQESVYCKLLLNATAVQFVKNFLDRIKPPEGLVQVLTLTEKQFQKIDYLVGEEDSLYVNNFERVLIL
jgi:CRISPR-associated protein Cas2